MKKRIGLAIFLVTFLAACALPTLPALPGKNPPVQVITITPAPTKLLLTATPSATFSPASLTAQAITAAENTSIAATDSSYFSFCNNLVPEWGFSSGKHIQEIAPDWVMIECRSSDATERYQKFLYKRGLKIWTIALSDTSLFPAKENYDISLDLELLSKDKKDVYLASSYSPKDDTSDIWDPVISLHYKTGLYHLNLDNGNLNALLDPNITPGDEFAYAISPDQAWLAFAKASEKNIFYLRNLRKGTDKKIQLKEDIQNIGAFVWTPDSQKLFFAAGPTGWRDNLAGTFLYADDITTGQLTALVQNDPQQRIPFPNKDKGYWLEKNFLHLISAQTGQDEWKLDIRNGYIGALATPTPNP